MSIRFLSPLMTGCTVALLSFNVHANVLIGGGMELEPLGAGGGGGFTFTSTGDWNVDPFSIVNAEAGVTPLGGSQMLRFVSGGANTDVYNVVDLTALSSTIDAGGATADLSAFFNALGSTSYSLSLRSFSGAEPTISNPVSGTSFDNVLFQPVGFTDASATSWEEFTLTNYIINAGTRYIAVGLHSNREFTSYADNVTLTISAAEAPSISEPGAFGILSLGLAGLALRRRKPRTT